MYFNLYPPHGDICILMHQPQHHVTLLSSFSNFYSLISFAHNWVSCCQQTKWLYAQPALGFELIIILHSILKRSYYMSQFSLLIYW